MTDRRGVLVVLAVLSAAVLLIVGLTLRWLANRDQRASRPPLTATPSPAAPVATPPVDLPRSAQAVPTPSALEATPTPAPILLLGAPRNATDDVRRSVRWPLVVHTFVGAMLAQPLAVAAVGDDLWLGGSMGLVVYRGDQWWQWQESAGLTGPRVSDLALAANGQLVLEIQRWTGKGAVAPVGTYRFEIADRRLVELDLSGWSYSGDGSALWILGSGLRRRDLVTQEERRWTLADGLLHSRTSAVVRVGQQVWVSHYGTHSQDDDDFYGGGVSSLDLATGDIRKWTELSGLSRSYTCSLAATDGQVWAAHWTPEAGLSVHDEATASWRVVRTSGDGVPLGGTHLLAVDGQIWVAQQGGLVRYDPASDSAVRWTEADGLPGYIVGALAHSNSAVWAATYAYGRAGEVVRAGVVAAPR